jgi:hypothetical protein
MRTKKFKRYDQDKNAFVIVEEKLCKSKCPKHHKPCTRPTKHVGLHTWECGCIGSHDYVYP